MKTPANYGWLYILGGIMTCIGAYADWQGKRKFRAFALTLGGLALILIGGYWWVYGGNF